MDEVLYVFWKQFMFLKQHVLQGWILTSPGRVIYLLFLVLCEFMLILVVFFFVVDFFFFFHSQDTFEGEVLSDQLCKAGSIYSRRHFFWWCGLLLILVVSNFFIFCRCQTEHWFAILKYDDYLFREILRLHCVNTCSFNGFFGFTWKNKNLLRSQKFNFCERNKFSVLAF